MKKLLVGIFALGSFSSFAMQIDEFYDDVTGDLSALISKPSLGDGILMSSQSNQTGVCKALGYERAALGSLVGAASYRGPMVVVGESGSVLSGEVATKTSGSEISQIVCLNKLRGPREFTHNISIPLHLDAKVPFSTKSNLNGVCKTLGLERAAVGSLVGATIYRGPMVVVGESGSVISGEVATNTSGFEIKTLVCITTL